MNEQRPNGLARAIKVRVSRRRVIGTFAAGAGSLALGQSIRGAAAVPAVVDADLSVIAPVPLRDAVASLEPKAVWENFYQLTRIPRPSHHEDRVSVFLAEFGRGLGLETEVDEVGNVLIRKPATSGLQDRQGAVLQAHMDMVPVKTAESTHDFETDPIAAYVEDGWARAEGTTLGADDGIGLALIMALLEADDIAHGPLEALFTVNEEDGTTGATALQPGVLQGTMLFNLDSEEEGVFTIGSAGGVNIEAIATYTEMSLPPGAVGVRLDVAGLQGGHSGIDIHRGRGNAIKLLARLLNAAEEVVDLRLASMTGGDRSNAIPRAASAVIAVTDSEEGPLTEFVASFDATVRQELAVTEPELRVMATTVETPPRVMDPVAQRRIIDALNACPNGVIRMSDAIPGLVESSTNLGTIAIGDGQMRAGVLARSAVESARDAVREMIASVFALAGAETSVLDAYPSWQPDPDSPLVGLMKATYLDLFGSEAEVTAVHAGLEASSIGEKYPEMDMISVGPTMENVHSPDERLEIASVGKVYDLLVAALERVPPV